MEHLIQLHIEKLPEGFYFATRDEVQGLIAQGRTIQETLEIARDVAKIVKWGQTPFKGQQLKIRGALGYLLLPRIWREQT